MFQTLKSNRGLSLAATLSLSALLFTACGGGVNTTAENNEGEIAASTSSTGTLNISTSFAPVSMNPAMSGNGRAGSMLQPAYEPLVRTTADGTIEPALAESWEVSDDNMSVTFTLRQDAAFSDGEPVNAEAAKTSVEYFLERGGPFTATLQDLASIDVPSEYEVTFNFDKPNPDIVGLFNTYWLAGALISPAALENPDQVDTQTFGAGPYVLDEAQTTSGNTYTYVPNEHYYDQDEISWEQVVISVYEDQNSAIQAFKTGQLDVMISDPVTANANQDGLEEGQRIVSDPVQWSGLVISDRDGAVAEPLGDVRVRQAMNYALDRETITNALFGDFGVPTSQVQVEGFVGHDPTLDEEYAYDPDKARELLAEAGYADGFSFTTTYVNNTLNSTQAQAMAGQFAEVGITMNTREVQNFGELEGVFNQGEASAVVIQSNSGAPYLSHFQTLAPNGSMNFLGSTDDELNQLLDTAAQLPLEEAQEEWQNVYGWLSDEAWFAITSALDVSYFVGQGVDVPQPGQSLIIDIVDMKPAE